MAIRGFKLAAGKAKAFCPGRNEKQVVAASPRPQLKRVFLFKPKMVAGGNADQKMYLCPTIFYQRRKFHRLIEIYQKLNKTQLYKKHKNYILTGIRLGIILDCPGRCIFSKNFDFFDFFIFLFRTPGLKLWRESVWGSDCSLLFHLSTDHNGSFSNTLKI